MKEEFSVGMRRKKIVFLYTGPHYVHATWAKAVGATFLGFTVKPSIFRVPFQSFINLIVRCLHRILPLCRADVVLFEVGRIRHAVIFKKRYKSKLIAIVGGPLFVKMPSRRLLNLLRYVDGFIAVSNMVKRDLLKYIKNKPVKVVYPFVSTNRLVR